MARDTNPRYYALIEAFRELTGVPMVLNTSFNENEPRMAAVVMRAGEGAHFRASFASVMSGRWIGSSLGSGLNTISDFDPVSSMTFFARP